MKAPAGSQVIGPPPRVPDPDPAWPPSAAWPTAPTAPGDVAAWLADRRVPAAQRRWVARHGAPLVAVQLVPRASLADGVFQLLTHRDDLAIHLTLLSEVFEPSTPSAGAPPARLPGGLDERRYVLAHAPYPGILSAAQRFLDDRQFPAAVVAATFDRLAADAGSGAAVRLGVAARHSQLAQRVLERLAKHPACPTGRLPRLLALALDPAYAPPDGPGAGAQAAFDRLRRAARRPGSALRALGPETLAPVLATAPAAWRVALLTEVLPALRPDAAAPTPPDAARADRPTPRVR